MSTYSPNPEVQATIDALLAIGCPPIPVAPKQNPRDEWCHRVARTQDGHLFCPIDKNLHPIPKFTGKNPSYLDRNGSPQTCKHGEFQTRLPTAEELRRFFCHPNTGIGTLGGHAGVDWLDFDAKCYPSQEACDADVRAIIDRNNLQNSWIERTGSDGWRIAVEPRQKPTFTNFATSRDGTHVGEALFQGRFTVLAPTIHPNGKPYRRTSLGVPMEVESLEAIGIFPSKDEVEQAARNRKREKRKRHNPNYGEPTNPQDNPWDIRNFAHYFEGYHERGDGWAAAKCPHHNGTSQTSFRVKLTTGEYKLWCGCSTKEVYKAGLNLAVAQGYRLPERDRPIDRDQWEINFGLGKRLRERVKRALVGFKGFGKQPAPNPQPKEAPDQLFQDANQRLQAWQDAVKQGHKFILDISAPGLGKSHGAGIALPEAFGVFKLWYLANDHRNPTTGAIEKNYVDLGVRNNGLKIDDSRETPNGNPFLVWPKPEEKPDTKGNCPKTDLFQKFRAKNLNFEAADDSPICETCKLAYLCKQGTGGKYGASFRGDRKNALAANRIRAHADSMPSPDDFDYTASGIFWDEVGTQLKPMDSITLALGDFDQVWGEMESIAPDLHDQLKPLRLALRPLLTGEAKQPFHGWDDSGIRALLPEKPKNLDAIITELEEVLQPNLDFLEETPDSISDDKELSKAQQRIINREFRRLAHEKFNNAFQQLALNWLIPFLKVWNGERGAFRCEWQQLTIFTKSDRHAAIARAAKFNIFLDATIDRERLALLLGIDPEEIYVVGQETPNHGNLRLIQITGMGKLGKDRSDSLKDRVAALKKTLEERYPGIVFGDWKGHTEASDGRWFVNLRGSNEFQNAPALAVFGIPYQNVGHLQALYQTLTGEFAPLDRENPHEGLQRFIEAHVRAEIEQAVGRLRSHLRSNEQLTFIFVGDYDLSFLGMPIEQVEAFQICPEAGTDAQITRWKILEAVRLLHDQSRKLTQVAIATLIGKSQELISKIASEFGGWKRLKKILLVLLNPPSSGSNIFSELTDDEKWLAQVYLPTCLDDHPQDAVEQIGQVIRVYGQKQFLRILTAVSPHAQAKLLSVLMGVILLQQGRDELNFEGG